MATLSCHPITPVTAPSRRSTGKVIIYDEKGRAQAAIERPKDVSFLLDTMDRWNKGGDSRFFGKIDMEHVGVAGHSFGGYTATAVADVDPRVKAIAPMAAVFSKRTRYDCPAMMVLATEDRTIKADGNGASPYLLCGIQRASVPRGV